jgi:hypothetical protein
VQALGSIPNREGKNQQNQLALNMVVYDVILAYIRPWGEHHKKNQPKTKQKRKQVKLILIMYFI